MGMFQNAWATYRLATSRQRALTEAFGGIGVNFMHLDTKFTKHLVKEAIETDVATVAAKYMPLVESITILSGHIVTPEFNRRLMFRFTHFGQHDRFIADFNEAIRLDPKDALAFHNRGLDYASKGQYDRAISDYDEAIRLDPNCTRAIKSRAETVARKNELAGDELVAAVDKRVSQYIQLRDKLKAMDKEFEEKRKEYVDIQNVLSGWLMEFLEKTGGTSIKTVQGTVYLSTRYSASLADPEVFMNFVIENQLYDLLDRRANSTAVMDYVKEKGVLPPGCDLNALKSVGVRRREDQETEGPAPLYGSVAAGGPNALAAALGQTAENVGDPTDAGSALDERIKYLLATV
jgi:hypothetical protein